MLAMMDEGVKRGFGMLTAKEAVASVVRMERCMIGVLLFTD